MKRLNLFLVLDEAFGVSEGSFGSGMDDTGTAGCGNGIVEVVATIGDVLDLALV